MGKNKRRVTPDNTFAGLPKQNPYHWYALLNLGFVFTIFQIAIGMDARFVIPISTLFLWFGASMALWDYRQNRIS